MLSSGLHAQGRTHDCFRSGMPDSEACAQAVCTCRHQDRAVHAHGGACPYPLAHQTCRATGPEWLWCGHGKRPASLPHAKRPPHLLWPLAGRGHWPLTLSIQHTSPATHHGAVMARCVAHGCACPAVSPSSLTSHNNGQLHGAIFEQDQSNSVN